jgi:hypothetical protein
LTRPAHRKTKPDSTGDTNRAWFRALASGWISVPLAAFLLTAADALVYRFIRTKGVDETGDEPHYLVVARAVSHFRVHPLQEYLADIHTHQLFNWPANTSVVNLQLYNGPHGPVSTHPIGLSVLLAPFVAAGGAPLGRLAEMAMVALGISYFFHRASTLRNLRLPSRIVLGLLLAAPAVWVATTQIYPDFMTGVLIAVAAVELLAFEAGPAGRRFGVAGLVVCAISFCVMPWLHQQDLAAAIFLLAGLMLLARRKRVPAAGVLVVAGMSILSWLALLAFNLYAYGHAIGLPQPFPKLNGAAVTEILGLLFDRHQGLFVQVPTAVAGLIGLVLAARRQPVAAMATLGAAAAMLYLNGTFIGAPYGGLSFAGRFQWATLVPLLVFMPYVLERIETATARVWALGGAAAVLWLFQAGPILAGHHVYFNQDIHGPVWDPGGYPGWWGPLDRLFPVLYPRGAQFGIPAWGLVATLAILAAVGACVWALTIDRPGFAVLPAGGLAVAAAGTALAANLAPVALPAQPYAFAGAGLGSPIITAGQVSDESRPILGIHAGSYRGTLDYALQGAASAQLFCTSASGRRTGAASSTLDPSRTVALISLRCASGTIGFATDVAPGTTLRIDQLRLAKTAG